MGDEKTGTELTQEQVTDIVKKKRGAKWVQDLSDEGNPATLDPGDNARFVRHAMASWDLPPIDISDPEQVNHRLHEYFQYCVENDRKPQIIGMANWLGVDRTTVNSWKRGEYRGDTHSHIIKKAIDIIEEMWIDFMQAGKINPATGIFLAKNFFQYSDTQQVVVTPNNPYQGASEEELKQKYLTDITETIEDE